MKVTLKLLMSNGAFFLAVAAPATMHGQMTGVSHPDESVITATPEEAPKRVLLKPAAGTPASSVPAAAPASPEVYGAYVPYHAPGTAATTPALSKSAFDPDANFVTSVEKKVDDPHQWDAGVVTGVEEREGEIREGTILKARTRHELSTVRTAEGARFEAELTEPVMKAGRVILPVGAVLEGRVTEVRGGRRIAGAARMHLDPRSVTLPDGTQYLLHAQLIDTSADRSTRVGSEGDLLRRDHAKATLAVMGGVTGAGAAAGAMMGGGVGAVVGAAIGAGAGTIVWLKQDRQATLPQDSLLVFSLTTPMMLKPMHAGAMGGQ